MKISPKVIIPMILLLITVLMNGLGATINLQYVMDSGTEINHIHFTNVYNLEQINRNFERLQKLIYTHCVAEDKQQLRDIEKAIDEVYKETEEFMANVGGEFA